MHRSAATLILCMCLAWTPAHSQTTSGTPPPANPEAPKESPKQGRFKGWLKERGDKLKQQGQETMRSTTEMVDRSVTETAETTQTALDQRVNSTVEATNAKVDRTLRAKTDAAGNKINQTVTPSNGTTDPPATVKKSQPAAGQQD